MQITMDDAFFDLTPYVEYNNDIRQQLSDEFERQIKLPWTFLSTHMPYDTMQAMYPFVPEKTIVDETIEKIIVPDIEPDGKSHWSWFHVEGAIDMPIHKDPPWSSNCWVGFNVRGDQELGFYEDDKETPIGFRNYKIALVNSKVYHAPRSNGAERLLLRRMFTENNFHQMKDFVISNFG